MFMQIECSLTARTELEENEGFVFRLIESFMIDEFTAGRLETFYRTREKSLVN